MNVPSSHDMPSPNALLVRTLVEGWNRGETGKQLLHDAVEVDITRWAFDVPTVWRGRSEVDPRVSSLIGIWERFRCDLREVVERGDRLVALLRIDMRGRASGVRLSDEVALLIEVRDGRACRLALYPDESEALAELAEDGASG